MWQHWSTGVTGDTAYQVSIEAWILHRSIAHPDPSPFEITSDGLRAHVDGNATEQGERLEAQSSGGDYSSQRIRGEAGGGARGSDQHIVDNHY